MSDPIFFLNRNLKFVIFKLWYKSLAQDAFYFFFPYPQGSIFYGLEAIISSNEN